MSGVPPLAGLRKNQEGEEMDYLERVARWHIEKGTLRFRRGISFRVTAGGDQPPSNNYVHFGWTTDNTLGWLTASLFAAELLQLNHRPDLIASVPESSNDLVSKIDTITGIPHLIPSKEAMEGRLRSRGINELVHGFLPHMQGKRVVLCEAESSIGESSWRAYCVLQAAGLRVEPVVILGVDREQGATELLGRLGFQVKHIWKLTQWLNWSLQMGAEISGCSQEDYSYAMQFMFERRCHAVNQIRDLRQFTPDLSEYQELGLVINPHFGIPPHDPNGCASRLTG